MIIYHNGEIWELCNTALKKLKFSPGIPDPIRFIPAIVSMLHLPETVTNDATAIILKAKEKGIAAGKSPQHIAGAAVYLTIIKSNLRPTQEDVSRAIASNASSLGASARDLNRFLNLGIAQRDKATWSRVHVKKIK